jgi:hypothetical protein
LHRANDGPKLNEGPVVGDIGNPVKPAAVNIPEREAGKKLSAGGDRQLFTQQFPSDRAHSLQVLYRSIKKSLLFHWMTGIREVKLRLSVKQKEAVSGRSRQPLRIQEYPPVSVFP